MISKMSYSTESPFEDKQGRIIEFEVDGDIIAHIQGKKIGEIQFDFSEDSFGHSHAYIFNMYVDKAYRRVGIGTEMIRLASNIHGRKFGRPSFGEQGGSEKASSEYFLPDGRALIRHCISIGIIDDVPDYNESQDDDWDAQ